MEPTATAQPEVVIEDPRIEVGRMMYADLPYEDGPQFRISEVTKVFFGRSDHWMRWLQKVVPEKDKPNYLVLDGREVGNRKTPLKCPHCGTSYEDCRAQQPEESAEGEFTTCCVQCNGPDTHPTEGGSRIFGLRDIEEIAYALAQQKRIDGNQLRNALVALDTVGRIWGVRMNP